MITFAPLWDALQGRDETIYDLEYRYGLNPAEISRLKHDHNFTLRSVDRYCKLLDCELSEVITLVKEQV